MKRAELTVGAELFAALPGDLKYGRGAKVRVVDTVPYRQNGYTGAFVPASGGQEVLVERLGEYSRGRGFHPHPTPYQVLARLADLRGSYEQVIAELEQRGQERDAAAAASKARRDAVQELANDVAAVAKARGLSSAQNTTPWHAEQIDRAVVTVAANELAALLDRLDALQRQAADEF